MNKLSRDAAMTESLMQDRHVYSLERPAEDYASDNERIRQWVRSLTEQEAGEDIIFAPDHIYAAEHFHTDFDFTQLDHWEILFYPKDRLPELLRKRKVPPEIRLFNVVSAFLYNGKELSTKTGFALPFAIDDAEEEAIYRQALAATNAWEHRQQLQMDMQDQRE